MYQVYIYTTLINHLPGNTALFKMKLGRTSNQCRYIYLAHAPGMNTRCIPGMMSAAPFPLRRILQDSATPGPNIVYQRSGPLHPASATPGPNIAYQRSGRYTLLLPRLGRI